jgi:hypothetical protein
MDNGLSRDTARVEVRGWHLSPYCPTISQSVRNDNYFQNSNYEESDVNNKQVQEEIVMTIKGKHKQKYGR